MGDPEFVPTREKAVALLNALFAARQYEAAVRYGRLWWEYYRDDKSFVSILNSCAGRSGELSLALQASHRNALLGGVKDEALSPLIGRLRELVEHVPRLAGPKISVTPAHPHRVMHLVKESRPYFSNGFAARSHHNFVAEMSAGLEPVIVTEPGFPNAELAPKAPTYTKLDGIAHYHSPLPGLEVASLPHDRFLQLFADLALQRLLAIRPAVIHASSGRRGYDTMLVALALKEKTGIPIIYEVRSFFEANWTPDISRETQGEIFALRMRRETECMNAADAVLTICETMREELVSRGIDRKKIGVIPNGVDIDVFKPAARDVNLSRRYGLEGYPTFGYVSNMDHPRESQETLIRATAVLAAAGYQHRCVLVGSGPRQSKLKDLATELGVQARVVFTGSVPHEEIAPHYGLLDTFVVPRIPERAATFVTPLKPFEAMAIGLPIIVSDLPALREVVAPPERGWAFPAGDHAALAQTILQVDADSTERSKRVSAAREWIQSERQWKFNGERYRRVIDSLADGEGR